MDRDISPSASTYEHALTDPAAVFTGPEDVLTDDQLTRVQKIEILRRWAYDMDEIAVAEDEGMDGDGPPLLRGVLLALQTLGAAINTEHTPPTDSVDRRHSAAIAGIVGPILFSAAVVGQGWLRDDYDSARQFVSALPLGPAGLIQNINFLIFGVLLLWLAHGLRQEFSVGKTSRSGPLLIAVVGVANIIAGLFNADSQISIHGVIHGINSVIAFILIMPASVVVFYGRFRMDPKWQWLAPWTLICGVFLALFGLVILLAIPLGPIYPPLIMENPGAAQRAYLSIFFVWLLALSIGLYRSSNGQR